MITTTTAARIPAQIGAFARAKESTARPGEMVQSLKIVSNDGSTVHWLSLPLEEARAYTMGQPITLVPVTRDGRETYDIEPDEPAGTDKTVIAAWITGQARLYAYCQKQAIAALPDGTGEDAVQGATSILYISACRKFGLER